MIFNRELDFKDEDLKYLRLLSEKFPNIESTSAEIINLNAILNLPKGTEHFISDIHGEHEAFEHVLRNCSGSIKRKVEETLFEELNEEELKELTTIIYYPIEKLRLIREQNKINDEWFSRTILALIRVCRISSSKYSHSKIRKAFPDNYAYIIQELLFKSDVNGDRENYYNQIIDSIIKTGAAEDFIVEISKTIRKLNIDHLHIVGDIYDRGIGPDKVMDTLMKYHTVDIQWGNHDVLWIGAALGQPACIANAIRICLRYGNTAVLERGYGINLLPLTLFAQSTYDKDADLKKFMPKITDEIPDIDDMLLARMQKAMSIIQFKLESEVIRNNPEYNMENRLLIDKVKSDYTVEIDGKLYELNSKYFPTIDFDDPSKLTLEEKKVVESLVVAFLSSEKLQRHMDFLIKKGSVYKTFNNNLLFHACVPVKSESELKTVLIDNVEYSGIDLFDVINKKVKKAYYRESSDKNIFWYLWCAPASPLFGKDKMATFERYFIDEKATHKEVQGEFYQFIESELMAKMLLENFGVHEDNGHIICGHVPVKAIKGEKSIKANGRIICIDAGFAKAYQKETGMAGCTLTYNSYGMSLIIHEPFKSRATAVKEGLDIISEKRFVNKVERRKLVSDTDIGKNITGQISNLEKLLIAYRNGVILQK